MMPDCNNGDYVRISCGEHVLGHRVKLMLNWLSRFKGLLGTRQLPQGAGAWLAPCSSVHMIGMLYSIDVLFLDRDQRIVNFKSNVKPFSIAIGGPKTFSTIELPASSLQGKSITTGDKVSLVQCR